MTKFYKENSLLGNSVDSFKTLIGYDLSSVRVVFEHDEDEIVFINEGLIGRIRVYLNGSLAYSGWDFTCMVNSSGWFLHKGKTYRVKSTVTNLLTFAQKLALSVDGEVIETKKDAYFGKLKPKEIGHLVFGGVVLGVMLATVLKLLGL